MLMDRNRRIKKAPQRFQETNEVYDVIVTCEERCFDLVCEGTCASIASLLTPPSLA
jgi:RNA polymerase II subunit A C-terminal domain phosphatase SSU72